MSDFRFRKPPARRTSPMRLRGALSEATVSHALLWYRGATAPGRRTSPGEATILGLFFAHVLRRRHARPPPRSGIHDALPCVIVARNPVAFSGSRSSPRTLPGQSQEKHVAQSALRPGLDCCSLTASRGKATRRSTSGGVQKTCPLRWPAGTANPGGHPISPLSGNRCQTGKKPNFNGLRLPAQPAFGLLAPQRNHSGFTAEGKIQLKQRSDPSTCLSTCLSRCFSFAAGLEREREAIARAAIVTVAQCRTEADVIGAVARALPDEDWCTVRTALLGAAQNAGFSEDERLIAKRIVGACAKSIDAITMRELAGE